MGLTYTSTFTLILPFVIVAWAYALGNAVDKDPADVKYTILAQEALVKYENDTGSPISYNVLQVTEVTEQIVSGILYRIDFLAEPPNCSSHPTDACKIISCHATIVDVPWLKKRDITIKCATTNINE